MNWISDNKILIYIDDASIFIYYSIFRFGDFLNEDAVISGLQPATVYAIRMSAVNSIDQSAFTEAIIVKTQEEEPSEAPKDVKIQTVGPGEIFLTWSVPPRESWNGELLGNDNEFLL